MNIPIFLPYTIIFHKTYENYHVYLRQTNYAKSTTQENNRIKYRTSSTNLEKANKQLRIRIPKQNASCLSLFYTHDS